MSRRRSMHVPFTYAPDPMGGTEIYVRDLCRSLIAIGHEAIIAAPGPGAARYRLDDVEVRRFAMASRPLTLDELYGGGDPAAAGAFDELLERESPDVVHQHALTPACSTRLAERAAARGIPVVFTYHTATTTCQRGSLVECGREICDGKLDAARCTACTLEDHGVDRVTRTVLAGLPAPARAWAARMSPARGVATAFRLRTLVDRRQRDFARLVQLVDRFVAPAAWVADVLAVNGVPRERIVKCPHGVPAGAAGSGPDREAASASAPSLKIAHLARTSRLKGTHLLIQAVRRAVACDLELDLYLLPAEDDGGYFEWLTRLADGDARIRFKPPVPHHDVVSSLRAYDVVAVPSLALETGPLVVLEAFAAGVPVVASDAGGPAEVVRHGVDGLLVRPFGSIEAWAGTLRSLADDPAHRQRLRAGVRPARAFADVAREMAELYEAVVARSHIRAPRREVAASR